jgi:hypothetical protein
MSKARENIPDQGINLLGLNVVHFLDGVLDLLLISPDVDNKHQSVIVFDLLHGRLRGERILEHLIMVQFIPGRGAEARILGRAGSLQSLGPVERHGGSLLPPFLLPHRSSLQRFCGLRRLNNLRFRRLRRRHLSLLSKVRGRNKSLAVDPLRSSIAVVRLQNLHRLCAERILVPP